MFRVSRRSVPPLERTSYFSSSLSRYFLTLVNLLSSSLFFSPLPPSLFFFLFFISFIQFYNLSLNRKTYDVLNDSNDNEHATFTPIFFTYGVSTILSYTSILYYTLLYTCLLFHSRESRKRIITHADYKLKDIILH